MLSESLEKIFFDYWDSLKKERDEARIERDIAFDKPPAAKKRRNWTYKDYHALGLSPEQAKHAAKQASTETSKKLIYNDLCAAMRIAQKKRLAEFLVNARPTRVYSMGGHVKPNDIVDVPSEVVNTEVGEPKVNNQQRDAAFSEAIRKLEPKKRLQAIVEGYLTATISTGTMSWELFEMFPFNDRERSQFENKLRRQYGVLHPSLHDFEEDSSTVSNIKDALR